MAGPEIKALVEINNGEGKRNDYYEVSDSSVVGVVKELNQVYGDIPQNGRWRDIVIEGLRTFLDRNATKRKPS